MKKYYCPAVPFLMTDEVYKKHLKECLMCKDKRNGNILGIIIRWIMGI